MKVKLLVVHGRPQGKSLQFPPGEFVFGRGAECHVRPNSDWVSRQHCLLRVAEDGVHLRDLGSRNGTLVNGTRVLEERRLENGDKVQVGPLVFQIVFDAAAPVLSPPHFGTADVGPWKPDTGQHDVIPSDTDEVRAMDNETMRGRKQE
jgi:predicted component of type VI protein secretion system